jgi:hypothetical protein
MHISLYGFVAGPNGEMNWTNINYEFGTLLKIHNS